MSITDMIKFKIKDVVLIRKTVDLPGPPPVLCPRPTGGSQHPLPQTLACFTKTAMPKFRLDTPLKQNSFHLISTDPTLL